MHINGEYRAVMRLTNLVTLTYSMQGKSRKLYTIFKWMLRSIFSKRVLIRKSIGYLSDTIVVAQSLKRHDLISQPVETSARLGIDYYVVGHRLRFNAKVLLNILKWIATYKRSPSRIFTLLTLLEIDAICKELREGNLSQVVKCIFHNEKQYYEGVYCIACNRLGITTLSVFHGFSRDTGRRVTQDNINPINYMDQLAKIQLCWGEIHQRTVKKYSKPNIRHYAIGTAGIQFYNNTSSQGSRDSIANLIILDSSLLRESNAKLIRLASTLSSYGVKAHPDDGTIYHNQIHNVVDVIGRRTVVWGCNSSAVLQLGRSGLNVNLLFESDFLDDIKNIFKEKDTRGFVKIRNYDWSDFIRFCGDEYYAELKKITNMVIS